jgi:RNA polymerase sigma-70 factor (ECF subfamily)
MKKSSTAMLQGYSDHELLDNLKNNNISAFDTIYSNYSKPLYIYLLNKLNDHELCNDILQDIFTTVWEKRNGFSIEISLKAYLFQAARHKIIDLYRRDVKYQKYLTEIPAYVSSDHFTIIDRMDQKKKLKELEEAVNNLPERMREIFILSRFEHQTTLDIARKTNLSKQTVKNQISKALRILRVNYMGVELLFLFLVPCFF